MTGVDYDVVAESLKGRNGMVAGFAEKAEGPPVSARLQQLRDNRSELPPGDFKPEDGRSIYIRGYAVTSAQDQRPVLGTSALGPCLGVAIYNPETRVGALAHIDTNTDLNSLSRLISQVGGQDGRLQVSLAGGQLGEANSHRMVEAVLEQLNQRGNVSIRSADVMNPAGGLASIALDTRTGEVYGQHMSVDMDQGPRQDIMAHHARTAMQFGPLRPEYVHGQTFSPDGNPLTPPSAPATQQVTPR